MSKFFSLKLYLQGLKKSRLQGITMLGIVTALTALIPTVAMFSTRHVHYAPGYVPSTTIIDYDGFAIPLLMLLLMAPILTLSMFSFLNKRNESDFYHSIPFTRPCVYFSFLASIMTWIVATLVVAIASATILWSLLPYTAVPLSLPFVHFIVYFLATLLLVAFTVVAMTLTGTPISNLLIFALLFLFVRVAGALFVVSMASLYPVVIIDLSFAEFLQIDYNIPLALLSPYLFSGEFTVFGNYGLWIYTAVVSIGLIAAGCWLYTRRHSEMAGQSAPNNFLQHTYRIMISLPFVFLMVYGILEEGFNELVLVLTVITLLVYYVYEIITTKRLKNLIKASAFLPLLVVGGVLFAVTITISGKSALAYTPDADEIKSISIYDPNMDRNPSYELMNTAGVAIDDPKVLKFVSDELKEMKKVILSSDASHYLYPHRYEEYDKNVYYGGSLSYDEQTDYVLWSIKIVGKSGRVCGRTLCLTMEEYLTLTSLFTQTKEYEDALLKFPTESEIVYIDFNVYYGDSDQRDELWESFVKEYNALSREEKIEYKSKVMQGDWYQHSIHINGMKGSKRFYSTYPIYAHLFPETARLYVELANENEKENFDTALKAIMEKQPSHAQLNLESLTDNAYFSLDNQMKLIRKTIELAESFESSTAKGSQIVRIHLWVEDDSEEGYYFGGTKYYLLTQEDLGKLYEAMDIYN